MRAQGQVFWANLEPTLGHEQAGLRPVVIVSEGRFNVASGTVIIMPLTSQVPRVGSPLVLDAGLVMGKRAWVKPSQVRTIAVDRLMGRASGEVFPTVVAACLDALMQICGRRRGSRVSNDV